MARLVAGLDIGSTTTKAVLVDREASPVRVVASAEAPSRGVKGDAIVDMQAVSQVVAEVLGRLGNEPFELACAVGGSHAELAAAVGVAAVRTGVVGPRDVQRVHDSARAGLVPGHRSELHLVVHHYRVGLAHDVRSPLGMHGTRLEAWGRIVMAERSAIQNLAKCAQLAGHGTPRFALGSLASAHALLLPEERDGAVVLVDVGGAATEFVAFVDGSPVHAGVVAIGGDHLTFDLVDALRTPAAAAERLKREHGAAHDGLATNDVVEVPGFGDGPARCIEQRVLCDVLVPRVEELVSLVHKDLGRAGAPTRPSFGYVLTGGGSLLRGLDVAAEELLGSPVRRAVVQDAEGEAALLADPRFSVAFGLAMADDVARARAEDGFGDRIREWFSASFSA